MALTSEAIQERKVALEGDLEKLRDTINQLDAKRQELVNWVGLCFQRMPERVSVKIFFDNNKAIFISFDANNPDDSVHIQLSGDFVFHTKVGKLFWSGVLAV